MIKIKIIMQLFLLLILFKLAIIDAADWNIKFENVNNKIHMNDVATINFTLCCKESPKLKVTANSSDETVAKVGNIVLEKYYGSFNVTGEFLGDADISVILYENKEIVFINTTRIIIIRQERAIDSVFTASVIVLVSILYINFGCAMDWDVCQKTIKRPIGPLIGSFCQFLLMPLISYFLAILLFPDSPEMQLGLFFTGISPSGGASNIWTILLGGNLNLSVTMTTLSTLAAFGLMPLWIITLGRHIFERGKLAMPYRKIATFAVGLIIPLSLGYLIQIKCAKFSKIMVKIMKPFAAFLIIFIVIFAVITNLYLFKLFSWQIILAGMGLPWLGFVFGLVVAVIFRQPDQDIRAIAIETGIQNTGISIFLLRFSLEQPAADMTTVVPVSIAIMTPIPLTVLYLIKLVLNSRKKKMENSRSKIREPYPETGITTISNVLIDSNANHES